MIGVRVTGRLGSGIEAAKASFLDRPAVERAIERGRRRALNRSGAYLRTTAKRLIRPRKGRSKPGSPPHSHAGHLRRFMFYGWDRASHTVVVGPAAFARRTGAPRVLELGGRQRRPKWWRGSRKYVSIKPRPYMAPATRKAAEKMPRHWANTIH